MHAVVQGAHHLLGTSSCLLGVDGRSSTTFDINTLTSPPNPSSPSLRIMRPLPPRSSTRLLPQMNDVFKKDMKREEDEKEVEWLPLPETPTLVPTKDGIRVYWESFEVWHKAEGKWNAETKAEHAEGVKYGKLIYSLIPHSVRPHLFPPSMRVLSNPRSLDPCRSSTVSLCVFRAVSLPSPVSLTDFRFCLFPLLSAQEKANVRSSPPLSLPALPSTCTDGYT